MGLAFFFFLVWLKWTAPWAFFFFKQIKLRKKDIVWLSLAYSWSLEVKEKQRCYDAWKEQQNTWSLLFTSVFMEKKGSSKFKCWWVGENKGSNLWYNKKYHFSFYIFHFGGFINKSSLHQISFIFLKDIQSASFSSFFW